MDSRKCRNISRREFIGRGTTSLALSCAALTLSLAGGNAFFQKPRIPIGLQLYSVRRECARDLAGTLRALAGMGYEGVEFAGYFDRGAEELHQLLEEYGLRCCGTHVGLDSLLGDKLSRTVSFNWTLRNPFLIVPSLPRERTQSCQDWMENALIFDDLAEKLKPFGMRVGYHNHSGEFRLQDEDSPWDTFFSNTCMDVVMQLDVGNALAAGVDPAGILRRYPGRAATVHLKESCRSNPRAFIGEGEVAWKEVFDLLESFCCTEWYIVEYEAAGMPPLESVARCIDNLHRMGK